MGLACNGLFTIRKSNIIVYVHGGGMGALPKVGKYLVGLPSD